MATTSGRRIYRGGSSYSGPVTVSDFGNMHQGDLFVNVVYQIHQALFPAYFQSYGHHPYQTLAPQNLYQGLLEYQPPVNSTNPVDQLCNHFKNLSLEESPPGMASQFENNAKHESRRKRQLHALSFVQRSSKAHFVASKLLSPSIQAIDPPEMICWSDTFTRLVDAYIACSRTTWEHCNQTSSPFHKVEYTCWKGFNLLPRSMYLSARKSFEKVLEEGYIKFGEPNLALLVSVLNFLSYHAAGNYPGVSLFLLKAMIQASSAQLGPWHPLHHLLVLFDHGYTKKQSLPVSWKFLTERLINACEEIPTNDDHEMLTLSIKVYEVAGVFLIKQPHFGADIPLFIQAIEDSAIYHSPIGYYQSRLNTSLAGMYLSKGDLESAKRHYERARSTCSTYLPEVNEELRARATTRLGYVYARMGESAVGSYFYRDGYRWVRTVSGEEHFNTVHALKLYYDFLQEEGDDAELDRLRIEAPKAMNIIETEWEGIFVEESDGLWSDHDADAIFDEIDGDGGTYRENDNSTLNSDSESDCDEDDIDPD